MDYEKILEIIKKLKDSAKRKLIKDIFLLLVSKEKQNNCAELVCPHCNSKYIVKNGKNKDKQRYVCVLTALDNSNILYAAPITMGRPASSDLIRVLQNRLKSSLYFSPCFIFYLFIIIIKLICTCICFNICIYYYYIPNNYLRTTNC